MEEEQSNEMKAVGQIDHAATDKTSCRCAEVNV